LLTVITNDKADAVAPRRPHTHERGGPGVTVLRSTTTDKTADNVVDMNRRRRRRSIEGFKPQGGDAA
jgi:hypothetical protein